MKKYIICLLISLYSIFGFGQSTTITNPELPKIALPNPESFQFTKYGDIPIGEYTGNLNYSLPIYNLKAANLELPISLNYNDAGVKVNDLPNKTGMSWLLSAGGVITRIIKDKADEDVAIEKRIYLNDNDYSLLNDTDSQPGALTLNQYANDFFIDTEIDVFTYSFDNYSGSFYLDKQYNAVLVNEESEIKILKTGTNTFTVTTPNGVKYYFGGASATERNFAQPQIDSPNTPIGNTAFYLIRIEHPVNGIIDLEYKTRNSTIEILGINQSKANLFEDTFLSEIYTQYPMVTGVSENVVTSTQFNRVQNPRFISKISSPNTNTFIKFNYGANTFKYILDNIEIKSLNAGTETLINQVQFSYLGVDDYLLNTTKKRFFLDKVIFNNQALEYNKKEIFSFEYDNPFSLPDRLSYSQDYMGYHNGKVNASFLPRLDYSFKISSVQGGFHIFTKDKIDLYNSSFSAANRMPDFQFAKKGSLIKINYPTKGYTLIDYEPYPYIDDLIKPFSVSIEIANEGSITNAITSSEIPGIQPEVGYVNFPTIYATQDVIFTRSMSSEFPTQNHMRTAKFRIINVTDNIEIYNTIKGLGYNGFTSDTFTLQLIAGKQYKLIVSANNYGTLWGDANLVASLTFNLITGLIKKDGLGLRVKKILSYNHDNSVKEAKTFYYEEANKIYSSPENKDISRFILPNFITYSIANCLSRGQQDFPGVPSIPGHIFQAYFFNINSNPTNDILNYFSNFKNNKIVTISYGGDNFENGGVQKIFSVCPNKNMGSITLPRNMHPAIASTNQNFDISIIKNNFLTNNYNNNLYVLNGKLIKETNFKKNNNLFYKLNEEENVYENTIVNTFTNFVGEKVFDYIYFPTNCDPLNMTSNYYLYSFKTFAYRNILKEKTSKQFFENTLVDNVNYNIPIISNTNTAFFTPPNNDSAISQMIKSTQTFEYGSLKGLPTKIINSTSLAGVNKITQNIYANQTNTLAGLTLSQIDANNQLIAQNNIANPIQVEQYENTNLISKQRTLYKQWNESFVLPEIIQTQKGNQNLEDRVIITEYDQSGNPTLFSYKDGIATKYLYNSNNQVFIKIENFTGTLNPNVNPITADPCVFITSLSKSFVTVYTYDPITNLLIQTMDSNCQKTTYVYDNLNRLKMIKDNNGNIIKEFDENYKQ